MHIMRRFSLSLLLAGTLAAQTNSARQATPQVLPVVVISRDYSALTQSLPQPPPTIPAPPTGCGGLGARYRSSYGGRA